MLVFDLPHKTSIYFLHTQSVLRWETRHNFQLFVRQVVRLEKSSALHLATNLDFSGGIRLHSPATDGTKAGPLQIASEMLSRNCRSIGKGFAGLSVGCIKLKVM